MKSDPGESHIGDKTDSEYMPGNDIFFFFNLQLKKEKENSCTYFWRQTRWKFGPSDIFPTPNTNTQFIDHGL